MNWIVCILLALAGPVWGQAPELTGEQAVPQAMAQLPTYRQAVGNATRSSLALAVFETVSQPKLAAVLGAPGNLRGLFRRLRFLRVLNPHCFCRALLDEPAPQNEPRLPTSLSTGGRSFATQKSHCKRAIQVTKKVA